MKNLIWSEKRFSEVNRKKEYRYFYHHFFRSEEKGRLFPDNLICNLLNVIQMDLNKYVFSVIFGIFFSLAQISGQSNVLFVDDSADNFGNSRYFASALDSLKTEYFTMIPESPDCRDWIFSSVLTWSSGIHPPGASICLCGNPLIQKIIY
jgi:hypothetical protein